MRVGILTFFRPINNGAVLQACAMNSIVLRKMGVESELIDYRLAKTEMYRRPFSLKRIRMIPGGRKRFIGTLKSIYRIPFRFRQNGKYNRFIREHMTTSRKVYRSAASLESECQGYDAYIVGSDLVWSPVMAEGINPVFFLSFVREPGAGKISYAPSVGSAEITDGQLSLYKQYLTYLDYISVREKTTALQFRKLTDKTVHTVLDPTLLTTREDWNGFYDPKPVHNGKYIFAFMLEPNEILVNTVNRLAEIRDCEIVAYEAKMEYKARKVTYITYSCGPSEFLNLMKNAESIVTNSYHGCAFSLIFHKDFYCIPHTKRGVRMIDLMHSLHLENRIVRDRDFEVQPPIDYEATERIRGEMAEESFGYLRNALAKG